MNCKFTHPKWMSWTLCVWLLLVGVFMTFPAIAQQTKVTLSKPVGSLIGGYLEHLPDDYASNPGKRYPLIIFSHGIGERGDGSSAALDKVLLNGPPNLLNKGTFPKSFTVNGETFKFIVISPQYNGTWVPAANLDAFIDYVIDKYRVDTNRIYLTGLSMGGGVTELYNTTDAKYTKRIAAIVPVCGSVAPTVEKVAIMAAENLPIWALHNTGDPVVHINTSRLYIKFFNEYKPTPNPLAKLTEFVSDSHNAWGKAYDPNFREDGKNVYEWMLGYTRRNTVPPPPPSANKAPVAIAGANQTLTLPVASATLDGSGSSDPDGSIASYAWKQTSGPAVTIQGANTAIATVSNITTAGTYTFELTVTDNDGAVSKGTVTLTIKPEPVVNQLPLAVAGADQAFVLPIVAPVALDGSGSSDPDGTISSYAWKQISGTTLAITGANTATATIASITAPGAYSFELTVTDDSGAVAKDSVTLTIAPEPVGNKAPIAIAATNANIQLPTNEVTLDGTASSDPDGDKLTYQWVKKSGSGGTIQSPSAATTLFSGLSAGEYDVALIVTDPQGLSDTTSLTIIVQAAPAPEPEPEPEPTPDPQPEPQPQPTPTPVSPDAPTANAGPDVTITLPVDTVFLDASRSVGKVAKIASYIWQPIMGSTVKIRKNNQSQTWAFQLQAGVHYLELTVTDFKGNVGRDTLIITVNNYVVPPVQHGGSVKTANEVVTPYNGSFQYGVNPGYYSNGWDDKKVSTIAYQAGVHTLRLALPDEMLDKYGPNIRKPEFDHYKMTLKMSEMTMFIEKPSESHRDKNNYGSCGTPKTFANLYEDIWDNGENGTPINDSNYFAAYVYQLLVNYGDNVRFWEIYNEPDYTSGNGGWKLRGQAGSWWDKDPDPCELTNLRAPVYHYIRMLRIAYEIIKTYKPDSYVCTGGIGYESFLDVLLRNTDNPNGGAVSPEYPLKGGAYFDVLSFHSYPMFRLSTWVPNQRKFVENRYSDEAARQLIVQKGLYDSVLALYGYGSQLPKKHVICTENNIPRKAYGNYIGSDLAQRNYTIKALVMAQANDIRQLYFYQTGETGNYANAANGFELMGLYENLKRDVYGQQKITQGGMAYKTTSDLLRGYVYDASATKALNTGKVVSGYAFRNSQGAIRYILWATTTKDLVEEVTAKYTLPAAIEGNYFQVYNWDYGTNASSKKEMARATLELSSTPIFVDVITKAVTPNKAPIAKAGADFNITQPVSTAQLDGSASSDPDGTITAFTWKQISGNTAVIATPQAAQTAVSNLTQPGKYSFELTVTDNTNETGKDTIVITVLAKTNTPETPPTPPVNNFVLAAKAGNNVDIYESTSTVVLDGSQSVSSEGIVLYKWTQISGATLVITNANAAKIQVTGIKAGTYGFSLTVTDKKGNTSIDSVIIVSKKTGNASPGGNNGTIVAQEIQIFPNPVKEFSTSLKLDFPETGNIKAVLYDNNGVIVWTENFDKSVQQMIRTLRLPRIARGMYYLRLQIDSRVLPIQKMAVL